MDCAEECFGVDLQHMSNQEAGIRSARRMMGKA